MSLNLTPSHVYGQVGLAPPKEISWISGFDRAQFSLAAVKYSRGTVTRSGADLWGSLKNSSSGVGLKEELFNRSRSDRVSTTRSQQSTSVDKCRTTGSSRKSTQPREETDPNQRRNSRFTRSITRDAEQRQLKATASRSDPYRSTNIPNGSRFAKRSKRKVEYQRREAQEVDRGPPSPRLDYSTLRSPSKGNINPSASRPHKLRDQTSAGRPRQALSKITKSSRCPLLSRGLHQKYTTVSNI